MSNISLPRDNNRVTVIGGTSSVDFVTPVTIFVDPITHRMKVDLAGSGAGTVTSVSVVSANGISGTVANPTTTPAITLDINGLDASKIADGSISNTEFQFLDGVSSNIQSQLNTKVSSISIASANGFSGSSSGGTTPALTIVAGAITPTSVNGLTITSTTGTLSITNAKTLTVTESTTIATDRVVFGNGSTLLVSANTTFGGNTTTYSNGAVLTVPSNATVSGTNTGDQTNITGNAGTATALQTARTINGVSFNGTANITIPTGNVTWTEVTGTTQAMSVNNGYILNNASLVTATLPSTAAVGDSIPVEGKGAGLFTIAQNSGQTIHFGNQATTTGTGGSLTSTDQWDSGELICVTANTTWKYRSYNGNPSIV